MKLYKCTFCIISTHLFSYTTPYFHYDY